MTAPNHEPSRKEIREQCWKIQDEWDEKEKWKRRGFVDGKPVLSVPRVHILVEGRRL